MFLTSCLQVPDYYDIIKKPIALSTIREKVNNCEYQTAGEETRLLFYLFICIVFLISLNYPRSFGNLVLLTFMSIKHTEIEVPLCLQVSSSQTWT